MSFIQKKFFNKKAFNLQVNIKGAQKLKKNSLFVWR